jgi:hypothetical protein
VLVEADAAGRLEVVAEAEDVVAAHREAVEVLDVEQQRLAAERRVDAPVGVQHVTRDAGVLAAQREVAEVDRHRRILGLGRRRRCQQGCRQGRAYRRTSPHGLCSFESVRAGWATLR